MGFPCCARGSNPKFTKMAATPVRMIDAPGVGGDRILKLASGTDHTLALTRSGKVLSWGCGLQGQLGRVGARVSDRARLATFLTPTAVKLPGRGVKVAEIYAGEQMRRFGCVKEPGHDAHLPNATPQAVFWSWIGVLTRGGGGVPG